MAASKHPEDIKRTKALESIAAALETLDLPYGFGIGRTPNHELSKLPPFARIVAALELMAGAYASRSATGGLDDEARGLLVGIEKELKRIADCLEDSANKD